MTPKARAVITARCARTRLSTQVKATIAHMVKSEAPYLRPDGLPSWWAFWSGCLVQDTRELVTAARALAALEGIEL